MFTPSQLLERSNEQKQWEKEEREFEKKKREREVYQAMRYKVLTGLIHPAFKFPLSVHLKKEELPLLRKVVEDLNANLTVTKEFTEFDGYAYIDTLLNE
jgi:hypothetical protein